MIPATIALIQFGKTIFKEDSQSWFFFNYDHRFNDRNKSKLDFKVRPKLLIFYVIMHDRKSLFEKLAISKIDIESLMIHIFENGYPT